MLWTCVFVSRTMSNSCKYCGISQQASLLSETPLMFQATMDKLMWLGATSHALRGRPAAGQRRSGMGGGVA